MGRLFGTDGIRGKANRYPLIPAMITRIGQAVATVFGNGKEGHIVVGTDTRISEDMIASAINSGICSCGVNVLHAGAVPTPAVAYLTANLESAVAGIVISASHNPYFDNGIKVFDGDGYKLPDRTEADIERLILDGGTDRETPPDHEVGRITPLVDADERYRTFLHSDWPQNYDLSGIKLIIDCANGATHRIAPALFTSLGAEVIPLFTHPDGKNINADCGSEHTQVLVQKVVETGAGLGVAFDGDGDRLSAVDETGHAITGDQLLAIFAKHLKTEGMLASNKMVSTVMSNIGLKVALDEMGIEHAMADVGDRRVMEKMKANGAMLGGEDSGHIIFLDRHTTGDGLLSALRLLKVMLMENRALSELAGIMTVAPQVLINVSVRSKPDLNQVAPVQQIISEVNSDLKGQGRVLVRYSGTQPMCRVMVEGPTPEITELYCRKIADVVTDTIGKT